MRFILSIGLISACAVGWAAAPPAGDHDESAVDPKLQVPADIARVVDDLRGGYAERTAAEEKLRNLLHADVPRMYPILQTALAKETDKEAIKRLKSLLAPGGKMDFDEVMGRAFETLQMRTEPGRTVVLALAAKLGKGNGSAFTAEEWKRALAEMGLKAGKVELAEKGEGDLERKRNELGLPASPRATISAVDPKGETYRIKVWPNALEVTPGASAKMIGKEAVSPMQFERFRGKDGQTATAGYSVKLENGGKPRVEWSGDPYGSIVDMMVRTFPSQEKAIRKADNPQSIARAMIGAGNGLGNPGLLPNPPRLPFPPLIPKGK